MYVLATAWFFSHLLLQTTLLFFIHKPDLSHSLAFVREVYGISSSEVAGTVLYSVCLPYDLYQGYCHLWCDLCRLTQRQHCLCLTTECWISFQWYFLIFLSQGMSVSQLQIYLILPVFQGHVLFLFYELYHLASENKL